MDDGRLKTILKEQREEYQNYLGVVVENVKSSLKLVVESLVDMQKQLVALREMVAKNTEDIETVRADMEIIKTDTEFIKNGLKKKIDIDEFAVLERRVAILEKRR